MTIAMMVKTRQIPFLMCELRVNEFSEQERLMGAGERETRACLKEEYDLLTDLLAVSWVESLVQCVCVCVCAIGY